MLLGLTCVIAGVVAMLSRKAPGRHPRAGTVYFWGLVAVFASSTALAVTRWAEDDHLFVLGALAFAAALVGRTARRRRWHGWVRWHVIGMASSYIVLLTAFYVDNGKSLPLWNRLSPIWYWLLPAAVGIPLIVWALRRHPPARHQDGARLRP